MIKGYTLSTDNNPTIYWVTSNGDAPDRIYFDKSNAMATGARYIDGFDASGIKTVAYMLDKDGEYTTDF